MASGSGWPYHHHHIHLSLQWLPKSNVRGESQALSAPAPWQGFGAQDAEGDPNPQMSNSMQAPGAAVESLDMAWPPRSE
jgi:hypothetical protein